MTKEHQGSDSPAMQVPPVPVSMPHLDRYLARHAARRASDTPDEHLLGLSIATSLARLVEINEELLLMARENQEVIRAMNDMNNVDKGEQHGQSGHTDPSGIG